MASPTRIFVNNDLRLGVNLKIDSYLAHHLKNVLRIKRGGFIYVFNGRDGEFLAEVILINKKNISFKLIKSVRDQVKDLDLWLLCTPLKKKSMDIVIEKATELGVTTIQPVITEFTNVVNINIDRLRVRVTEASQQCRRLTVPDIQGPLYLDKMIEQWNPRRRLFVFDETLAGERNSKINFMSSFSLGSQKGEALCDAILVGPEGGFSVSELELLDKLSFVTRISLGDRILRSETAVIVALALWNELIGFKG